MRLPLANSETNVAFPEQNSRMRIRKDMLSNHDITRSASSLILIKLQLIVHDDSAHNRVDRNCREKPTRTRLTPESEVHICRADADETARCGWDLVQAELFLDVRFHTLGFLAGMCGAIGSSTERVAVIGILAPAETVETIGIVDEDRVFAHRS